MKVISGYRREVIKDIVKNCGSKNVKSTYSYLDVLNYHSKDKFKCETIDDVGFFAGVVCKNHFRLIEIAVREDTQSKGIGTLLLRRIKNICSENNLTKITLRTSINETAVNFFKKKGAVIVGIKGEDYEMEIKL